METAKQCKPTEQDHPSPQQPSLPVTNVTQITSITGVNDAKRGMKMYCKQNNPHRQKIMNNMRCIWSKSGLRQQQLHVCNSFIWLDKYSDGCLPANILQKHIKIVTDGRHRTATTNISLKTSHNVLHMKCYIFWDISREKNQPSLSPYMTPSAFTPDLKLISFTNPFLHSLSGSCLHGS